MKELLKKIYRRLPSGLKNIIKKIVHKENKQFTKEKLLKKIMKYDVISFDIFDTLISRIVYKPDDIFMIIGEKIGDKEFINKRKNAEQQAIIELKKDVNLDDIYNYYHQLYKVNTDSIKELEIDLEISFCVPRKDMLDVFNSLLRKKKTVILTSDMYLKKDTIIKMLEKCGYDRYDKLYLSNDLNKRKDTKEIWPYLRQIYKNKRMVHIGDNLVSDVINPKEYNIDTIKIESPRELFSQTEISKYVDKYLDDNSNSILLGLLINKTIFNSPFSSNQINTLEDFGYAFYGPILNEYLKYISTNTKDTTLLFLAREGYYLQKLYEYYCNKNDLKIEDNIYFLASRKAITTANISNENDISNMLNNNFNGNIKDYFKQLLDIDYKEENFHILLPDDKEKVLPIILKYKDVIIKKYNQEKKNYLAYIKNTIGDINKKKISIIDLGYSGTIQYELSKLNNKDFDGYYLTNSDKVKRYSKDSNLNFLFDINNNKDYEHIYHYSLILEFFLSAPFGQLIRFDNDINPVYNNETIDKDKQKSIDTIYKEIINYIDDVELVKNKYDYNPSIDLICLLYTCLVESGIISKEVKDKFDFVDSFCSNEKRNVFKIISKY